MHHSFNGMTVVSFESRRAKEIEKLIAYHGGSPVAAPSMKEVPLEDSKEAHEFAEKLMQGAVDIVILLTGVGTRALVEAVTKKVAKHAFVDALSKAAIVARGPKPQAALKELGLAPTLTIPEPNTWRDILSGLDEKLPVEGKIVAVQEYGAPNPELVEGLEERGAKVMVAPVYKWALPDDLTPLKDSIILISEGKADIALFTSAQQVRHLLQVAKEQGMEDKLRSGFKQTLIGSIGPTTTRTLEENGLIADYEPDHPKMGYMVREIARNGHALLHKKRRANDLGVDTNGWRRCDMIWSQDAADNKSYTYKNSVFLKACRREPTDYTPIWIMRQAGRFLREYRELRRKVTFLQLCRTPEIAAEATLMAVDRLQVDAAIIFSDILLILNSLGLDLEYSKGDGPVIHNPVTSANDVGKLREFEPETLDYVYKAIRITRRALSPDLALIGFAGAPFTVASYAIEGGGSKNYIKTKSLMYSDPLAWRLLMEKLSAATASYLNRQIEAGADAVQLFDSWVGCLSAEDYKKFVMPHMKNLIENIKSGTPVIHFGTGTATLLMHMKEAGGDVIGLDWRVDLKKAWGELGYDVAVQGNLDPVAIHAPKSEMERMVEQVIDKAEGRPGHIFNLGHGVFPNTPVDNVLALVDKVHEYTNKKSADW